MKNTVILAAAMAAVLPALAEGAVPAAGRLVHRYTFDGTLADAVNPDDSGLAAAICAGDGYTADGKAVDLAGNNDASQSFIALPANLLPKTTGEATVEIFFRPKSRPVWSKLFFCGDTGNNGDNFGFSARWGDGTWGTSFAYNDHWGSWDSGSGNFIDGNRYHIVASVKALGDNTTVMWHRTALDANEAASEGQQYGCQWFYCDTRWMFRYASQANVWIGRGKGTDGSPEMEVEEVRVWDYAFSEEDAKASAALGPDALPTSFDGGRPVRIFAWDNEVLTIAEDLAFPEGTEVEKMFGGTVRLTGNNTGISDIRLSGGCLAARVGEGIPEDCHITVNSGCWAPLTNRCEIAMGTGPGQMSLINGHKIHLVALDEDMTVDFGGEGADLNLAEWGDDIYLNYSFGDHEITIANRLVELSICYVNNSPVTLSKGFSSATRDACFAGYGTVIVRGDSYDIYSIKAFNGVNVTFDGGRVTQELWEHSYKDTTVVTFTNDVEIVANKFYVGDNNGYSSDNVVNFNGQTMVASGAANTGDGSFVVGRYGNDRGVFNMTQGSLESRSTGMIGEYGTGTYNQSGGEAVFDWWLVLGRYEGAVGTMNISGGTVERTGTDGSASNVAEEGSGTLNVSAEGRFAETNEVRLGCRPGVTGAINVTDGGVFSAGRVYAWDTAATSTVTVDGGTVETTGSSYFSGVDTFTVGPKGATFDVGGNAAEVLADSTVFNGYVMKTGEGTLTFASLVDGLSVTGSQVRVRGTELVHRYRFDGGFADDVTGRMAVGAGTTFTGGGKSVSFGRGDQASNKVDLGADILPKHGNSTVEMWFTFTGQFYDWSKIFMACSRDSGSNSYGITANTGWYDGDKDVCNSEFAIVINGQNYKHDSVDGTDAPGWRPADYEGPDRFTMSSTGTNFYFAKDHRYHVLLSHEIDGDAVTVRLVKNDLTDPTLSCTVSFTSTVSYFDLSHVDQINCSISGNQWGNWTPGMEIEEFRVWDIALTDAQIAETETAGPDVIPSFANRTPSGTVRLEDGGSVYFTGCADLTNVSFDFPGETKQSMLAKIRAANGRLLVAESDGEITLGADTFSGFGKSFGLIARDGRLYAHYKGFTLKIR